ncbi:MAG: hypothetical protein D6778_10875 [Nitrospirae bacterium]|nr:MAG: hypothetical protein D6778_10875 [Nitrospirota bacterium]
MRHFLRYGVLVVLLTVGLLAGCSSGFNEKTGVYKGNSVVITFPEGWKKAKTVPNSAITVSNPEGTAQMTFFVQKVPEDMSLDDFLKLVSSRTSAAGVRELERGDIEIDGLHGKWIKRAVQMGGQNFVSVMYYAMKHNKIYTLMGITTERDLDRWGPVFDDVAEGMKID